MHVAQLLTLVAAIGVTSGCGKSTPPNTSGEAKPDSDLDRLQGVWAVESIDTGNPVWKLERGLKLEDIRVQFRGDRMGKSISGRLIEEMAFKLEESTDPKSMTVNYLGIGKENVSPWEWLYKFEADKLVMAVTDYAVFHTEPKRRPTDFTPKPGTFKDPETFVHGVAIWRLRKTDEQPLTKPTP